MGEYLDRQTAMARVEECIEHAMEVVLKDGELYRLGKRASSKKLKGGRITQTFCVLGSGNIAPIVGQDNA